MDGVTSDPGPRRPIAPLRGIEDDPRASDHRVADGLPSQIHRITCMKTLLIGLAICGGSACVAAEKGMDLPRSSPEAQGVSSAALLAFVDAADRKIDAMNSVMLVRHGHVVAEGWWSPYGAGSPHMLYSL